MPELPEIEAVKRVMEPQIKGLAIQRLTVRKPEVIAHPDADEFDRQVTGQIFAGIGWKGKFLILCMKAATGFGHSSFRTVLAAAAERRRYIQRNQKAGCRSL